MTIRKSRFLFPLLILSFLVYSLVPSTLFAEIDPGATPVATPTFNNPDDPIYPYSVMVDILCGTPGATIFYTTDGQDPTAESTPYEGAFFIFTDTTVKAIGVLTGMPDSAIAVANYHVTTPLPPDTPVIDVVPDFDQGVNMVTISCASNYDYIFFTFDGSDPHNGQIYDSPFPISGNATIQAVAIVDGQNFSAVASQEVTDLWVAMPVIDPGGGAIFHGDFLEVSILCANPLAAIHYTTDGGDPSPSSPLYTGSFLVTGDTTVRAIATQRGLLDSQTASATFTFKPRITFTPPAGPILGSTEVGLSSDDPTIQLVYWLNNDMMDFQYYTGPFWVEIGTTVHAAQSEGPFFRPDTEASAGYTDGRPQVDVPTISPDSTEDNGFHLVEIQCATAGAVIHYTTDKSVPTESSPTYGGPFGVTGDVTIKAAAFAADHIPSDVAVVRYGSPDQPPTANAGPDQTIEATTGSGASITLDGTASTDPNGDALTYRWELWAILDGGYDAPYTASGATPTLHLSVGTYIWGLIVSDGEFEDMSSVQITISDLQANLPIFSPEAGTFDQPTDVWIYSERSGMTIYYTTDGSVPDTSSRTAMPVRVIADTTLRAIAVGPDQTPSDVATANYVYRVATPVIDPAERTIHHPTAVTISCGTPDAEIRYTLDGEPPTRASTLYEGAFLVGETTTVRAVAFVDGIPDSETATATFTLVIVPTTATPVLTLSCGTEPGTVLLTLTCSDATADIYFTDDGSDPDISSPNLYLYRGEPVLMDGSIRLFKAVAVAPGMDVSGVASAVGLDQVRQPVVVPGSMAVGETEVTEVTIDCETSGATLYYTTNGSMPTVDSPVYTGPFTVTGAARIRVFAVVEGMASSPEAGAGYRVVAQVSFDPAPGPIIDGIEVSLSSNDPTREIVYWYNDLYPYRYYFYEGPFVVWPGTTVYAAMIMADMIDFETAVMAEYPDGREQVLAPVILPESDLEVGERLVEISCATTGAEIRYTTDRSWPNQESTLYTGPFFVSGRTTIRAVAFKEGCISSSITTVVYGLPNQSPIADAGPDQTAEATSEGGTVTLDASGTSDPDGDYLTYLWSFFYFDEYGEPQSFEFAGRTPTLPGLPEGEYEFELTVSDGELSSFDTVVVDIVDEITNAPWFSPRGGTFTDPQSVWLHSDDEWVTIYYTTDGSEPTHDSKTAQPIVLTTDTTLRAIASTPGRADSEIVSATFEYRVATPVIDPPSGEIYEPTEIYIFCRTEGATIHYTLDGTTPTVDSPVFEGFFGVSATTTIQAVAFFSGIPSSYTAVSRLVFVELPATDPPTIELTPGNEPLLVQLRITCDDPSARLFYTTDGSDPDPYQGTTQEFIGEAYVDTGVETIKALALAPDHDLSEIVSSANLPLAQSPIILPDSRTVETDTVVDVTITGPEVGASIYYTLDGSTPTTDATLYTGTFQVTGRATIKAFAVQEGMAPSGESSVVYRVPPHISFNPPAGPILTTQFVTISCDDPNMMLVYALDGGPFAEYYGDAIEVLPGETLYAAVGMMEWIDPTTLVSAYYPDAHERVATPEISPGTDAAAGTHHVTLACATLGAAIYYSTDKSDPRNPETNHLYTGGFNVVGNVTVKAVAIKDGMLDSFVAVVTYGHVNQAPTADPGLDQWIESPSVAGVSVTLDGSGSSDPEGDPLTYTWRILCEDLYGTGSTEIIVGGVSPTLVLPVGENQCTLTVSDGEFDISASCRVVVADEQTNLPAFSQPGGNYTTSITLSILPEYPDDSIYYTTDGSAPTLASTLYTHPLTISSETTVRAIAHYPGLAVSDEITATYTFRAATPVIQPGAGTYSGPVTVTILCDTPGAMIFYTTDGTTPNGSSSRYVGGFLVESTTTVKAIAAAPGLVQSFVASATFDLPKADILQVISPSNASLNGTDITAVFTKKPKSLTLDFRVSAGATWALFKDEACRKPQTSHDVKLDGGGVVLYVKVTAADGLLTKVYKVTLTAAWH